MEGNPFLGGVVEREPAKPKGIIAPKGQQPSGFPIPPRKVFQSKKPETTGNRSMGEPVVDHSKYSKNDMSLVSANLAEDENMRYVMAMSDSERLAAEQELMTMMTPESIERLRALASKKFGDQMTTLTKSADSKNLPEEVASTTGRVAFANTTQQESSNVAVDDMPNSPAKKMTTRIKATPDSVSLTSSAASTNLTNRSNSDKFNLNGCKVVDRSSAVKIFAKAVGESSFLSEWGLQESDMSDIAAIACDTLFRVNFVAEEVIDGEDNQQQRQRAHQQELQRLRGEVFDWEGDVEQEEEEEGVSGYTFTEISEYFRSENASQRLLAAQILQGILRRRDEATALEAYGDHLDSKEYIEEERLTVGDFASAYQRITQYISNRVATIIQSKFSSADAASELRTYNSAGERARLHRIVTFAMMTLSASELPTELPTLILWSLQRPRLSPSMALAVLSCLRSYVSSCWEEKAAEELWCGVWGAQGTPSLPMPHARRSELSYEEYVSDCAEKRSKAVVDDDDESEAQHGGNGLKPPRATSVFEAFALRCRWGRVDNLIQESSAVEILCGYVSTGADLLRIVLDTANKGAANNVDYVKDTASRLALLAALCAIEILQAMIRQCDFVSAEIIVREIVAIWPRCAPFLESDAIFPIEFLIPETGGSKSQSKSQSRTRNIGERLCTSWWRLIAELSRKNGTFAAIVNRYDITSKALILLLKHPASRAQTNTRREGRAADSEAVLWALRSWRVCLAYGYGLDSVIELLIAAQMPATSIATETAAQKEISNAIAPGLLRCIGAVGGDGSRKLLEILWILEQAALTTAAVLDASISDMSAAMKDFSTDAKRVVFATNEKENSAAHPTARGKTLRLLPEKAVQTASALIGPCQRLLEYILKSDLPQAVLSGASRTEACGSADEHSSKLLLSAVMHFVATFVGVCLRSSNSASFALPRTSDSKTDVGSAVSDTVLPQQEGDIASVLNKMAPHCVLRTFKPQSDLAVGLAQATLTYASLLRQMSSPSVQNKLKSSGDHKTADADSAASEDKKKDPTGTVEEIEGEEELKKAIESLISESASVYRLESSVITLVELATRSLTSIHALQESVSEQNSAADGRHLPYMELTLASQRLLASAVSFSDAAALAGIDYQLLQSIRTRQESIQCTVSAVSEGLLRWHESRIQQAQFIADVLITCELARANHGRFPTLIATILAALPSLGQGFRKSLRSLLTIVVDVICLQPQLLYISDAEDASSKPGADINEGLRQRLLTFVLGPPSKEAILYPVDSCAECGVVLNFNELEYMTRDVSEDENSIKKNDPGNSISSGQDTITNMNRSICGWQSQKFDSKLPLSRTWTLRCLTQLRGPAFGTWLQTLYRFESHRSNHGNGITYGSNSHVSLSIGVSLAEKVYALMKVCCPEHAFRWLSLELPDGVIPSEEELSDVSETTVKVFLQLLTCYVDELLHDNNASYVDGFIAAAQRDASPAQGLLARASAPLQGRGNQLRLQPSGDRVPRSLSQSSRAEVGINEVCAKLLDAATGQYVDARVHAAALVVVLSPRFSPWKIQERVWRQLAELRLLHLLEEEDVLKSLFALLSIAEPTAAADETTNSRSHPHSISPIVGRSILSALTSLRSEEDVNWLIVSIAVYLIASSIFCAIRTEPESSSPTSSRLTVRSAQTGRFLKEIICGGPGSEAAPVWLANGVILATSLALESFANDPDDANRLWRWDIADAMRFHDARLCTGENGTINERPNISVILRTTVSEGSQGSAGVRTLGELIEDSRSHRR